MNLHEYQGKEILSTFGVKIQKGIVVNTPQEAVAVPSSILVLLASTTSCEKPQRLLKNKSRVTI